MTLAVVLTVSASTCVLSFPHTRVAVAVLPSSAQVKDGSLQSWPRAGIVSVLAWVPNASFLKTAVHVLSPFSSQVATFVISEVVYTTSVWKWLLSRRQVRVAVATVLSVDQP